MIKTLQNKGIDIQKRLISECIMNKEWMVIEEENYKNEGWIKVRNVTENRRFDTEQKSNVELNRRADYLKAIGYTEC